MTRPSLRRLIDLPGLRELEHRALMKPRFADPDALAEHPELDAFSRDAFGLTYDEALELPRPAGWDDVERLPARDQADAFEAQGWDVTDDKRRPLRLLPVLAPQLWLAVRGAAGRLPHHAEAEPDPMKSSLAAEAARFRRDRR